MPELPEVQTTVDGLQLILKKYIYSLTINTTKLRYKVPKKIIKLSYNRKIIDIYRIAKYIIIELSGKIKLIFHLGMSGRMRLIKIKDYKAIKHDHILVNLNDENILVFNDPRKFGFIDYSINPKLEDKKYLMKLGLDPFSKTLNKKYLFNKFKYSKRTIKQLLLDQKIIAGIGNIYACEILFDSQISPFIPGKDLNIFMIIKLIKSIRKVLKKAILHGGSTLQNYSSIKGTIGNFQKKFKVYNRENERILNFKIYRIKQCGRSTFFCPEIQKSKYNPSID